MIPQKNPPAIPQLPHFCLLYLHDSLFQIEPPSQSDGPLSNWGFPLTSTNQAWMLLETQPRELGRRIILRGHTNDLRRERMPNDSIRESLDRIAIIIFCRTDDPTIGESDIRSEEHTSELQSLMRSSYAVFCLKKKQKYHIHSNNNEKPNNNTHRHAESRDTTSIKSTEIIIHTNSLITQTYIHKYQYTTLDKTKYTHIPRQ